MLSSNSSSLFMMPLSHLRQVDKKYPTDEMVGVRVCLLLISSHIQISSADNAQAVIERTRTTFLPQPLPSSEGETVMSSPHQPLAHSEIGVAALPSSPPGAGNSSSAGDTAGNFASGGDGAEFTSAEVGSPKEACIDQEALRRRLQVQSVRTMLSFCQPKLAAKEMKVAILQAVSSGDQLQLSQICLKSQVRHMQCQPQKALKVLNARTAIPEAAPLAHNCAITRRDVPSQDVWFYNNLAVVNWRSEKPALALSHFDKAINTFVKEQSKKAADGQVPSLYNNCAKVNATLCYNMGCSMLHFNTLPMVLAAFDLFIETLQLYPKNPRLWLHLAECCIAVHHWKRKELEDAAPAGVKKLGNGMLSKLLLIPPPSRCSSWNSCGEAPSDSAFPEPKLPFGRLCLQNALKLLPTSSRDLDELEKQRQLFPALPSLPMRPDEVRRVKCAVLCCAAYTDLCLDDHQGALTHASALISLVTSSPATSSTPAAIHFRYLGHLYAAEALVFMNKISPAVKHLEQGWSSDVISSIYDGTLLYDFEEELLANSNLDPHQLVIKYNLSVTFALREDFDKALTSMKEIWDNMRRQPPRVVMLAIYLNLKKGHLEKAQQLALEHLQTVDPKKYNASM
ncbi:CCR4-NOT transcription complex subunit 10 isoform X2 [Hyalella azteca]|uniref:CCR4-NOT transcription complex subunit 10 n=1 Tax=Hyalella azteca TaxID=294128 RepID=A0A8B7NAV7_HYAAZ|nr:CCR4-NOT transcription complex subunit 10 isoform X2 [Hyalella azteca]